MNSPVEYPCRNPPGYDLDFEILKAFEGGLNLSSPENSRIPCRVLGYGEISTVIEIQHEGLTGLAFKRMSIFERLEELECYLTLYQEYLGILEGEIGLCLPPNGYLACESPSKRPIFYIIQKQIPYFALGNKAINLLSPEEDRLFFRSILGELKRVWGFCLLHPEKQVALDGQISNWAIEAFNPQEPCFKPEAVLLYMDTSSPFLRLNQVEQLDPELFLRAAPSFMVWILRMLFLKDVMNRYYDPRKVTIDLLANLYKEQRPELVPILVEEANAFFTGTGLSMDVQPITEKEVSSYYNQDKMIWRLYLSMRRLDRFLHVKILHNEYPYILPGKTKR